MAKYREIVEPKSEPERRADVVVESMGALARAKSRGGGTIIRAPKCNRLHCGYVWIFLGTLAAGGMALTGASLFVMAVTR